MLFPLNLHALPQNAALKTVVLMRLAALSCLILVFWPTAYLLDIALPAAPIAATLALLLGLNYWSWRRARHVRRAIERDIFI
jgi:hypothetical protein